MRKTQKTIALFGLALLFGATLTSTALAAGVTTDKEGKIQTTKDATTLISPLPGGSSTVPYGGLGGYINSLFKYGIGLAALLALAQLIFGAVQYTTSAGVPSLQEDAKSRMRGAIIGLILLILSTAILATLTGGSSLGLKDPERLISDAEKQEREETLAQLKKDLVDMEADLIRAETNLANFEKASAARLGIYDRLIKSTSQDLIAIITEKERNYAIFTDPASSEKARDEAGEAVARALTREQKLNANLADFKKTLSDEQDREQNLYDIHRGEVERTKYGIEETKRRIAAAEAL